MFKKIYNRIFGEKSRAYQVEAYEALSFRESYRGWLILVFVFSWLITSLLIQTSWWSVIFMAPFYALLLYAAYQGSSASIIMLMVFWLMEKFNNFAYLFLDYYKLIIVLILGLIFFPLAFNALRVEYAREKMKTDRPPKKLWHVFVGIIILVFAWLISLVLYYYLPFAKARASFRSEQLAEQSVISNSQFGFNFKLNDHCQIKSDILNHLADDSVWAGNLLCQKNGELTMFVLADQVADEAWQKVENMENVYTYDQGKMWDIIIYNPVQEEVLVIGGWDNNLEIKQEILANFKNI